MTEDRRNAVQEWREKTGREIREVAPIALEMRQAAILAAARADYERYRKEVMWGESQVSAIIRSVHIPEPWENLTADYQDARCREAEPAVDAVIAVVGNYFSGAAL